MKKIFALVGRVSRVRALSWLRPPGRRIQLMKKDATHMSKPMHHMKKDTTMHKDNMKGDKMMKDDAPKT